MLNIENIITQQNLSDADLLGKFDISKQDTSIIYEGLEHKYFSTGFCREVYISPDKTYVLKIPIIPHYESRNDVIEIYKEYGLTFTPVGIRHNIYEFEAYQECPDKYLQYFAKTEYLQMGWLKQEFVKVVKNPVDSYLCRELGFTKNNSLVVFDFDVLLNFDFSRPEKFDYQRVVDLIERAEILVKVKS